VFLSMAVLAELISVELFAFTRGSRVSVTGILAMAAILALGPSAGAILAGAAGAATLALKLIQNPGGSRKEYATALRVGLFNTGMFVIATTLAGYAYLLAGGLVGAIIHWSNLPPVLLAVTLNELLNVGILMGVMTIQTGKSVPQLWQQVFAWGVPLGIISGFIGGATLAIAYEITSLLGLLVFLLPILSTGYAFRLYIKNTRAYVDQLETANRDLAQANLNLDEANLGLLETLGAVIDAYDMYTFGHSAQTALYVEALAKKLGLPPEQVSLVVKAALVHDIGKIGVSDTITSKPSRLSPEEYHLMQQHPLIGADILRPMSGLQELAPIVRHHHERWDGRGYPAGLAGEEIPLGARILTVADSVDAMLSNRPYRPAHTLEQLRRDVAACSGSQFDPRVAAAMLQLLDEQGPDFFRDSSKTVRLSMHDTRAANREGLRVYRHPDLGKELHFLKKSSLVRQQ